MRYKTFLFSTLSIVSLFLIGSCEEDKPLLPTQFVLQQTSVTEGSSTTPRTFTILSDQPVPSDMPVTFSLREGRARFLKDFIDASGTLQFNQSKEATLSIDVVGDTHSELTETFDIVLNFNSKEHVLTVTIKDDDALEPIETTTDGFISSPTHESMELIWSDEFSGTQLNTNEWTYETGNGCAQGICGWGNNELQSYTNESANSSVANGVLTITAIKSSNAYSSARIKTQGKKEFTFGRIDVRAKLPKGKGIWPAIWMLGSNITSVGWPRCGEIDIMELVGHQPQTVHGTIHYDNDGYKTSSGSTSLTSGDFSDQYHVFTLVWDNDILAWYVDNQLFKTFTRPVAGNYPFNSSFFFIVNVAVGGNWPGSPDETTVFPQEMKVDYIRVFQ